MDERFFDEDGNLVSTSWGQEQEKEDKENARRKAEQDHIEALKSVNRTVAIEEKKSQIEREMERSRELKEKRREWMTLPAWIKSMPRTPLTDPPTEGKKAKLIYNFTGKVQLTDEEKARRIRDLKMLKVAIDDHRKIHQVYDDISMLTVPIIPLYKGVGATTLTRYLSRAALMSRGDMGVVAAIDLGDRNSRMEDWFPEATTNTMFLRHVLMSAKNNEKIFDVRISEIFPRIGRSGEYYLCNHKSAEKRMDVKIKDLDNLYRYLRGSTGITFIDCDGKNKPIVFGSYMLAMSRILVVSASLDAPDIVDKFTKNAMKVFREPELFEAALKSTSIIIAGHKTSDVGGVSTKEDVQVIINRIIESTGINRDRIFFMPVIREMMAPPMKWNNLKFPEAHLLRKIVGAAVQDVAKEDE